MSRGSKFGPFFSTCRLEKIFNSSVRYTLNYIVLNMNLTDSMPMNYNTFVGSLYVNSKTTDSVSSTGMNGWTWN